MAERPYVFHNPWFEPPPSLHQDWSSLTNSTLLASSLEFDVVLTQITPTRTKSPVPSETTSTTSRTRGDPALANPPTSASVVREESHSNARLITRSTTFTLQVSSASKDSETPSKSPSKSETPPDGSSTHPLVTFVPPGEHISSTITLSKRTMIGIVIGAVVLAIGLFFVGLCIRRRRAAKSARRRRARRFDAVPYYAAEGLTSTQQRLPSASLALEQDVRVLRPPSYATVATPNLRPPLFVTSKRTGAPVNTMAGVEVGVTYQRKPGLVGNTDALDHEMRRRRMSM
ncbi:hypothetical protein BKA70DRAFT_1401246 [Coprinopsis sp. MPI-PUGE-AT-0042]|nr:hypothetical protein BKA70DRAFT_1401246 [Coprinopsis sp. MPI-PUGE-AT-0042]